ncbi:protein of unknown function DUF996 [Ignisphaera aggregans DSM 17230]|uniref:DUF996 domain-containing protein n=1 Tax=Ignisphaera aggregans (strain DSM 17230 / JCM 13409 / AQ1.S1) TaxID=583356 RepID=E0SSW3_IGNAA|nr:protein of unknown function DUF996 [Ignisphaera aggregans DSM 17230]
MSRTGFASVSQVSSSGVVGIGNRIYIGDAKTLGLAGAIVSFVIWVITFVASLISELIGILLAFVGIVGIILVYLGISKISEAVNDAKIKNSYLIYFILSIVSLAIATIGTIILRPVLQMYAVYLTLAGIARWLSTSTSPHIGTDLYTLIVIIVLFWISIFIPTVVGTWYLKKSYDLVKMYVKVEIFSVAGLLYFIGGILSIILIGIIIMFIANIIEIVAWASTPEYIETVPDPQLKYIESSQHRKPKYIEPESIE